MKTLVCTAELDSAGDCPTTAQAWVDLPESPIPPLSLELGVQLTIAILGVWTLGLVARLIIRSGQANRYNH